MLFKRAVDGENMDFQGEEEEAYQRLFMKIGRDFVFKEDLYRIIQQILAAVDPESLFAIDYRSDVAARRQAAEYKALMDVGAVGSGAKRDLIDLSED